MKKSLRTILASLLALCFMFAFAASAGAAEAVYELIGQLETVDYGNLIEYDYINKTERVIPMDSMVPTWIRCCSISRCMVIYSTTAATNRNKNGNTNAI